MTDTIKSKSKDFVRPAKKVTIQDYHLDIEMKIDHFKTAGKAMKVIRNNLYYMVARSNQKLTYLS